MNSKLNEKHAQFINWMPPFIEVLKEKGGAATVKEIRDGIIEKMDLDDDFLAERYEKSGLLKFNNQVYWAKQYLTWEKLVETSKHGIWSLTKEGLKSLLTYDEAYKLFRKWIKIHSDARKERNSLKKKGKNSKKTVSDEVDIESDSENLENISLLDIIKSTTPTGFEHLCARLLLEHNFDDINVTKRSGDGGIDGTAILKLNPFVNMSVYFQCKKYEDTVPVSHIREFVGVLASDKKGVDRGLFISTGRFTKEAYELERKNKELELVDGEKLTEMFEKVGLGLTPRIVYDPDMSFFAQFMEDN